MSQFAPDPEANPGRLDFGAEVAARVEQLELRDAGHGFDALGMSREGLERALHLARPLYERYFRVRSSGAHNIPASGPVILASNHSGMLPLDGMMICVDAFLRARTPRVVRAVGDYFIPLMPVFSTFFARAGVITGSRGNVRFALEQGELLLIFPEGAPGIGKSFWNRYQLAPWRVGHAELAIRHGAPIVPVAVIGAEEQWPVIGRITRLHPFGVPYLPIPLTPLPLPVRYHIHYGLPIPLHEQYRPEDADDPEVVAAAAERVQLAVESLISAGLAARKGIFR
ncbi:MAG: acyltransferase family protein [Myxococcales bacterium]|nr:acyltransferase family protein [Myxococcales bacterium]MCB9751417.1 acyltransferase family protein [Myxococcales bacterium]